MITTIVILLPVIYYVATSAANFWKNWQDAKKSGIPYVLSPVYGFDRMWLLTERLWFPIINRMPAFLTTPWKDVTSGDWSWKMRYAPFATMKTDTFIVVNPKINILMTADASVINQITTRRNDFPKPIELYQTLDIYGKNVVTTEGNVWRRHRKITAPPFGEQNNRIVWKEAIFQANEMLRSWLTLGQKLETTTKTEGKGSAAKPSRSVASLAEDVSNDAMRLSLHVITRAGFDVRCLWPDIEHSAEASEGAVKSSEVPQGHQMSFADSIKTLLHRVIFLILFPDWFLRLLPLEALREARTAYQEWGLYMQNLYDKNVRLITSNVAEKRTNKDGEVEGLDLMGSMIEQSGLIKGTPNYGSANAGMSQSEIIGNSFVFFLAGHETAANSIHFCILHLALRPGLQRRLQAELDSIFGKRDPLKGQWDYDEHLPKLFGGLAGAIMNEELRLIPPVVQIPKSTEPGRPMSLTVNGKECTLAGGTNIGLSATGVHRNPKYWPCGPARTRMENGKEVPDPIHAFSNVDNDMEEFKPERWFSTNKAGAAEADTEKASDDLAVNSAPDTATTMYRPPKGAYIPFSEGFRSCVGRRFAQVEILATLAVIFQQHSIELSVDEDVSEAELTAADAATRKSIWETVRRKTEHNFRDNMGTVFTLQLRGSGVKVRVCPRGQELFNYTEY